MKLVRKNAGFSLVEVIIATVIFSIASVGLFSTFSSMREASARSERRLQAAYYAKQLLEDLRAKVDQSIWGAGANPVWGLITCDATWIIWPAAWGGTSPLLNSPYFANVNYRCTEIAPGLPGAGSRQVELRINWTEP